MRRRTSSSSTAIRLIAFVAVVAAISLAKTVLLPIAIAILLAFALAPIVRFFERPLVHLGGRVSAIIITVVLASSAFLGILGLGVWEAGDVIDHSDQYRVVLQDRLKSTRTGAAALNRILKDVQSATELPEEAAVASGGDPSLAPAAPSASPPQQPRTREPPDLLHMAGILLHGAAVILMTGLLLAVVLLDRENLRDRLVRILGVDSLPLTQKTITDATERISRYLLAQAALNALFGTVVGVGLFLLGVPSAGLLGIVAALLRFVPYLGTLTSVALGVLAAIATSSSWTVPLLALALYAVIEGVISLVLEPWLYGRGAGLSLFGVVVAISFWGWLWGIPGLLVAVPLTACVVLLARHFSALEPLSVLMSDAAPLTPIDRFHHRLLTGDATGARAAVHEHCSACSSSAAPVDDLWLASLRRAAADLADSRIDDHDLDDYFRTGRELLAATSPAPEAQNEPAARPQVILVCASNPLDRLGAEFLAAVLRERAQFGVRIIEPPLLIASLVEQDDVRQASGIVIVSLARSSRRWSKLVARAFSHRLAGVRLVLASLASSRTLTDSVAFQTYTLARTPDAVIRSLQAVRPAGPEPVVRPARTILRTA